jgi:hypothetical protein
VLKRIASSGWTRTRTTSPATLRTSHERTVETFSSVRHEILGRPEA